MTTRERAVVQGLVDKLHSIFGDDREMLLEGIEFLPQLVQVDALLAEPQGPVAYGMVMFLDNTKTGGRWQFATTGGYKERRWAVHAPVPVDLWNPEPLIGEVEDK